MIIDQPKMYIDSGTKDIDANGSKPIIYQNRTFVPIRAIIEGLGGTVIWSSVDKKTTLSLNGITMELWIDKMQTKIDGVAKTTDVAPMIVNSRTMLPVRFVSENFGANVDWKENEKIITISTIGNPNSSSYDITKVNYTDKNIKISYPQISNLINEEKQSKINKLIMLDALKVISSYQDNITNLTLDIQYEIKLKASNILSIQYLGYSYLNGAAYPIHLISTTNVNINKEKLLKINDIININESLIEKYKAGKYIPWGSSLNLQEVVQLKV